MNLEKRITSLERERKKKAGEPVVILIAQDEEEIERKREEYLKNHPEPGRFVCILSKVPEPRPLPEDL